MNNIIKADQPTELKNLISYEEGSIANLDIAHADNMKFVLMAFDEGTGLTPHRAPGNAILTALEGKAIIGYEGKDYELNAGESFRFDKNGLHRRYRTGQIQNEPSAGDRISNFLITTDAKNPSGAFRTGSFSFSFFSSNTGRNAGGSTPFRPSHCPAKAGTTVHCRHPAGRAYPGSWQRFSWRGARVSTASARPESSTAFA